MHTIESPTSDVVWSQLERVLESRVFSRSERLRGFLRFVVEEKLAGRQRELKEYAIATRVYERAESFDPAADTIVRVEARRLRSVLARYYAVEGRFDPLRIDIPKGRYEPVFRWNHEDPGPEVHQDLVTALAEQFAQSIALGLMRRFAASGGAAPARPQTP